MQKKSASENKKSSYEQFREQSRQKSRHRKKVTRLHETIAELESRLAGLEKEALTIDGADWERLNAIINDRQELEERLLELYLERDSIAEGDSGE